MPQDFYDPLQPFEYIRGMLEDNKPELGLANVSVHDDTLIPEYPSVLLQIDNVARDYHATGQFIVEFHIDLWVFHALMSVDKGGRSTQDIALATAIRKLLHSDRQLGGHIIDSIVDGEFPGVTARAVGGGIAAIVTTRLTWMGQNRVPYEMA